MSGRACVQQHAYRSLLAIAFEWIRQAKPPGHGEHRRKAALRSIQTRIPAERIHLSGVCAQT
jgi:hypothetical protein